jgi:peptidoglycan L-alanyl-D-glutamate endopeptidase CwlK
VYVSSDGITENFLNTQKNTIMAVELDILFYQRFLRAGDFYHDTLNGKWDSTTNDADAAFHKKTLEIADQEGRFDARSEENIKTLTPKTQIAARKFLAFCKSKSMDIRIISGTRTYAEQNAIYEQGRSKPGKIVTHSKGGQSNHNFGIAWDIGIFQGGKYITDDHAYKAFGELAIPNFSDLEWGGNWKSFIDYPHYQLKAISSQIAVVRENFENGTAFV